MELLFVEVWKCPGRGENVQGSCQQRCHFRRSPQAARVVVTRGRRPHEAPARIFDRKGSSAHGRVLARNRSEVNTPQPGGHLALTRSPAHSLGGWLHGLGSRFAHARRPARTRSEADPQSLGARLSAMKDDSHRLGDRCTGAWRAARSYSEPGAHLPGGRFPGREEVRTLTGCSSSVWNPSRWRSRLPGAGRSLHSRNSIPTHAVVRHGSDDEDGRH